MNLTTNKGAWVLCVVFGMFSLVPIGCIYKDQPMPEITTDYSKDSPVVTEPVVTKPTPAYTHTNPIIPSMWMPPARLEKSWTAIVVHHSATDNGNAAIFDKWHREGNHWEGVGYHFVIGNGTNSADGQVEVTFRWVQQKTGAHTGGTPNNWANRDGIGICLVGNFNKTYPTRRQMQSLTNLVRFLKKRYNIPKSRIYGHRTTPGAHVTDCPGRNFPMAAFKSALY